MDPNRVLTCLPSAVPWYLWTSIPLFIPALALSPTRLYLLEEREGFPSTCTSTMLQQRHVLPRSPEGEPGLLWLHQMSPGVLSGLVLCFLPSHLDFLLPVVSVSFPTENCDCGSIVQHVLSFPSSSRGQGSCTPCREMSLEHGSSSLTLLHLLAPDE